MAAVKSSAGKSSRPDKKDDEIAQRLEYVKIITRTKASVCNWHDLERQIMKGAI